MNDYRFQNDILAILKVADVNNIEECFTAFIEWQFFKVRTYNLYMMILSI